MRLAVHLDIRQRTLLAAAINEFTSQDRTRGMSYYRQGAVQRILPAEATEGEIAFVAKVQSS